MTTASNPDPDPAVHWHTDGPVATITLHRPACRNAVDGATATLLREAFERFEADYTPAARCPIPSTSPLRHWPASPWPARCAPAPKGALNRIGAARTSPRFGPGFG